MHPGDEILAAGDDFLVFQPSPFLLRIVFEKSPALPKVSRHQVHQVITDAPFYVQLRKVLMNA